MDSLRGEGWSCPGYSGPGCGEGPWPYQQSGLTLAESSYGVDSNEHIQHAGEAEV